MDKVNNTIDINNFFPRYISNPRLIYFMELDTFIVLIASFVASLVMFIFAFQSAEAIMFFSGVSTAIMLAIFKKFKESSSSGLIAHYFYNIGLKNPMNDLTKEEKLEFDNLFFIPYGYEDEFID
jgi:type IV conjugative transfer system protein TraL